MKASLLLLAVGAGFFALGFLGGCATDPYAHRTLSNGEYQFLYPRQNYDSLSPFERRQVDEEMQREQLEEDKQRTR